VAMIFRYRWVLVLYSRWWAGRLTHTDLEALWDEVMPHIYISPASSAIQFTIS